ncbi:MAG TPA: sialidase family protein [Ktedonobacterales bacterium]|nr:sialidase family protein [Ktedonobacterales bacterium]
MERDREHTTGEQDADRQRRQQALNRLARERLGTTADRAPPAAPAPSSGTPRQRHRRRPLMLILAASLGVLIVGGAISWAAGLPARLALLPTATPAPRYTLSGGGPCVQLGNRPQPPYANIQVTHDSAPAHSEPLIAEDPQNPLHLVGGSKFFSDPAHYRFQIGYAVSSDGGCTWTDGGLLPGFAPQDLTSDPTFAFGAHGEVYAAVLHAAIDPHSGAYVDSSVAVLTSMDGGRSFGAPVTVYAAPSNDIFNDKPWIAVDRSNGPHRGALYVVWSYDHSGDCGNGNSCSQELAFSRSTDGGRSFSPVRMVEGSAPFCTNFAYHRPPGSRLCDAALGATPLVEPDGTLAVAFAYENLVNVTAPTRLLVITSRDGGDTWSPPALVTTVNDVYGLVPPTAFRTVTLPAFACDPATGQLYLVWSERDAGEDEIAFSTSSASGASWSAPLRVNDDPPHDGVNHVQPQIAVAPDGVVTVMFFDSRRDPQHRLLDVYIAQSIDHGATFLPNERVTTQSFDPGVGAPTDDYGSHFFGDYQGLVADNRFVHPFWNDSRSGMQQIVTAAVPSALPPGS